MKSYQQYCGLARGLDLVGDRWTLLIIRELALGNRRYGQLQADLVGIPTNLLADRLRVLTSNGLVAPVDGAPGPNGYALTPRGRGLVPVLQSLVRWATPTMLEGPGPGDRQNMRWVAFAVTAYLRSAPTDASVSLRLSSGDDHVHVAAGSAGVTVRLDDSVPADVVVTGSVWALLGLVSGSLPLDRLQVVDPGATVVGAMQARRRVEALIAHNHTAHANPPDTAVAPR